LYVTKGEVSSDDINKIEQKYISQFEKANKRSNIFVENILK